MLAFRNFRRLPSTVFNRQPWPPSLVAAPKLNPSEPVEEENTPDYHPSRFYPTRLGEVLNNRYQIATKLGYGSSSTVWLARDLNGWRWSKEQYVAVKVNASRQQSRKDAAKSELEILERITQTNSRHDGSHFVRKLNDSFTIDGMSGSHICLVFEPLREPLWLYCRRFVGGVLLPSLLKITLRMILQGLDYLHSECQVIHTDLKLDNVMVRLEDPSILERDARDEFDHPLPQKVLDDRMIYLSRNNYGQFSKPTGIVQIVDFGLSVLGDRPQNGAIQAENYRAPEVILDTGYTYSADIWSLGVMLWDLLEGRKLFNPLDAKGKEYDDQRHLAQITALLGPPPNDLLAKGRRTSLFYEADGRLKNPKLVPQDFSLESAVSEIQGEEKRMFLNFVKRMMRWQPEERSTAKELAKDPWLYTEFSQN